MADIRIKDLPETLDVGVGDYVAVDNAGDGTRKYMLRQLVTSVSEDISDVQLLVDDHENTISSLDTRVAALESGGGGRSGLTQTEKNLILALFEKAAYAENDAGSAYDQLESLWLLSTKTITYNLSHVSSSNATASIESGQSYTTTLTTTGSYALNTVTVTMGGVDITSTAYSSGTVSIPSVTGNIVITATAVLAAQSITATYTQSGTVYDTDSLNSLKADLVVTANYSGGTSETVPASAYTLSGTLTEGTSTITVSYAGLTDTFAVMVTHVEVGLLHYWNFTTGSLVDTIDGETTVTIGQSTTIASGTGITIGAASDYVAIPFALSNNAIRAKVKLGAINRTAFGNERLLCISSSLTSTPTAILRYDNTNSVWENNNNVSTGITDPLAFANAELTLMRNNGSATNFDVIFNGETIISNFSRGGSSNAISVGSKDGSSFYTVVVESIKVYSE